MALRMDRDGAVAIVTLDRPDQGNAINEDIVAGLLTAASTCDRDPGVGCVLLTGSGKLFCGGGDIHAFSAMGTDAPRRVTEQAGPFHAAIARLMRVEKPVVVAVNGPAAGAGLSLALLGDIVLASPTAHFTVGYTAIGLTPDGGASWLLPRLVGLRRAQELMLTNRRVGAEEAVAIGLVTRLVGEEELMVEALSVAQGLAAGATRALGRTRALLLGSSTTTLETQMELESRAIATSVGDPEGREGVAAFLERRTPHFRD